LRFFPASVSLEEADAEAACRLPLTFLADLERHFPLNQSLPFTGFETCGERHSQLIEKDSIPFPDGRLIPFGADATSVDTIGALCTKLIHTLYDRYLFIRLREQNLFYLALYLPKARTAFPVLPLREPQAADMMGPQLHLFILLLQVAFNIFPLRVGTVSF
jgi:hypothetical protein